VGSKGTLRGAANVARIDELEYSNAKGTVKIPLTGEWFPDGFRGTLGEFLRAIEEDREPSISAADNLKSLELCFAAVESADTGKPIKPGSVLTSRL
jgi:predicted dehydrogenase